MNNTHKKGRYFLNRVIKINLSQTELMDAICNPAIIKVNKYDWTITDIEDHRDNLSLPFIYGCLSKYSDDSVTVIDENTHTQIDRLAPNLLRASSPFVYLPNYSGLCFLSVYNEIQEEVFPRRFNSLIVATREQKYYETMIGCDVEPISDYIEFNKKLIKIKKIVEIQARVSPPNPLFGSLWKSLKDDLLRRNSTSLSVKEHSDKVDGLNTELPELVEKINNNKSIDTKNDVAIADAALLMAADGYGSGKVVGENFEREIIEIKTSDTRKSFLFDKKPSPYALAERANEYFLKINQERHMEH